MLRLLARTIAHLWESRPADATAIHLHHMDPGNEGIRQEIVTRLGQSTYLPAITNDIAGPVEKRALAQEIDAEHHGGLPPYTVYVARTIFMHTLAFNDPLKGISPEQLRYSILGPGTDISFIEEARRKFIAESAYLDDRPAAPMRFLAEANLLQIIRREERHVDAGEARAHLNDCIRQIFGGTTFEAIPFPGGPFDVPDEVGDGRPKLVVLAYDALTIGSSVDTVPELIQRIYSYKGAEGSALRILRNSLAFVVADDSRREEMQRRTYHRLALRELKKPDRLVELAEHQQNRVREQEARSEQELALAIQQCYRHVFYPSRNRAGTSDVDLAHSAIDVHSSSDKPGAGQQQIVRTLRDLNKLRLSEDEPDSPAYVRDRTPLKKGQITTLSLRDEFRRDPSLPTLVGDDIFIRGVRRGIEQGEYVYQRGDLLFGPGDPLADIKIDEQSLILTMAYARNAGIWPRKPEPQPERPDPTEEPVAPPTTRTPGSPDSAARIVRGPGHPQGSIGPVVGAGQGARCRPNRGVDDPHVRGRRRLPSSRRRGGRVRRGQSRDLHRRLPDKGRRILRAGEVRRPGAGRSAGQGIPRAAVARRHRHGASQAGFVLTFADGLSMKGDAAENLTERLARFASGAAYVSATAKAQD